ncbi:hypothetical protein SAICODRAFT_144125 [Saitoella complicata NRRL Y-17804]|uniref:uncharacterized protein n=1 Tax=Saitoella complicata (strain BCRC 22490 / CBS 7301 / JCM 7358 / NBRC 10748 / NRRL Y-17804) TaxID=698492 RepID=UPI000867D963|nr:uncharacterized protein SAICODRAFT_144125 [Saitoella complicata NRRL Y-17804]ODQ51781.1 hypothetical protein SAICODRAFT_144125 [Saitoella complicata NRRL Y-17804]
MSSTSAVIDYTDFWSKAHILHPFTTGTAAILALWLWIRIASNRTLSPSTTFDWIASVSLGSTLSRTITSTQPALNLCRGLFSLLVILLFQAVLDWLLVLFPRKLNWIRSPPVMVVCRGRMLQGVMKVNRIAEADIWIAMRSKGVRAVKDVEIMVLEATGQWSIYPRSEDVEMVEACLNVPGYVKWLQENEGSGVKQAGGRRVQDLSDGTLRDDDVV